ncbi:MAG: hypothetical protein WCA30_14655 [Dermatophilaceae bacterium]
MERYEITVDSTVGPVVLAALEGFEVVEVAGGHSRLVGSVIDQAAFYGMLNRLHDLRLEIVEIHRMDDT